MESAAPPSTAACASPSDMRLNSRSSLAALMFMPPAAPTAGLVAPAMLPLVFTSLKEALFAELESYAPGHPAGDPGIASSVDDIAAAISLIRALPSGIPLPVLMRNDEGRLGMYWDNDDVYVDIDIDGGGTLSLFSRMRSSGAEQFLRGVAVDQVDAAWAYLHLGALAGQYAAAA